MKSQSHSLLGGSDGITLRVKAGWQVGEASKMAFPQQIGQLTDTAAEETVLGYTHML